MALSVYLICHKKKSTTFRKRRLWFANWRYVALLPRCEHDIIRWMGGFKSRGDLNQYERRRCESTEKTPYLKFGSFLLTVPHRSSKFTSPTPLIQKRSRLWLVKVPRAWVETLRHLQFHTSIMVWLELNQWVGVNRKDSSMTILANLTVVVTFQARVFSRLALQEAHFRTRISLGVVLMFSLVCALSVQGHLRSGSVVALK